MKKWQIVLMFLLVSGMMAGCFSQDKDHPSNTTQESGKKEQSPVQEEPASPDNQQKETDTSTPVSSDQNTVVKPPAASEAVKGGQTQEKTSPSGAASQAPTITAEQISSKYKQELTNLRVYYVGELQSLYGGALADVRAKQATKQAIFAKYSSKARAIQEESQAKVNQVLARMKQELVSHQLPTEKVNEYRSTYYSELDSAKNKAMAQVKKALGM